jgi:hypothetical protein
MEKVNFKNEFGQLTENTLTINRKNGSEEIAMSQITSVSTKSKKSYVGLIFGFIVLVLGFTIQTSWITDEIGRSGISLEALFLWIVGILMILSNWFNLDYSLVISVSGINRQPIHFRHSKKSEGLTFASAIKQCME